LGRAAKGSPERKPQEAEGPREILVTHEPLPYEGTLQIGDCFEWIHQDLDGDNTPERLCLRVLTYKRTGEDISYESLIADVFLGGTRLLRQELDRGLFYQEQFYSLRDLDDDGQPELITRSRLSPDCAGCDVERIHAFRHGKFVHILNIFQLNSDDLFIKVALRQLPEIKNQILNHYKAYTEMEHPCGYPEENDECTGSELWLLDSDRDDGKEVIQLLEPPPGDYFLNARFYNLYILELAETGAFSNHAFYPFQMGGEMGFVYLIGFLGTHDGHTHALVNLDYPGTSTAYPVLHVLDVSGVQAKEIGKFCGFYLNRIPHRLRDLDDDGNTEIIYVGEVYWPPGGAHADVEVAYEIGEYRNGRYVEASREFLESHEKPPRAP
jgi:hypothetical protein